MFFLDYRQKSYYFKIWLSIFSKGFSSAVLSQGSIFTTVWTDWTIGTTVRTLWSVWATIWWKSSVIAATPIRKIEWPRQMCSWKMNSIYFKTFQNFRFSISLLKPSYRRARFCGNEQDKPAKQTNKASTLIIVALFMFKKFLDTGSKVVNNLAIIQAFEVSSFTSRVVT